MIAAFIVGMFFGGFCTALIFIPNFRTKIFAMMNKKEEEKPKVIKRKRSKRG